MPPYIRKLAIVAAVLLLVSVSLSLVMPWIVDAEKRQKDIHEYLQSNYSLAFDTTAEPKVSTFPSPKLTFEDITIKDDTNSNIVHASAVVAHIGWLGLWDLASTSIEVVSPDITLTYDNTNQLMGYLTSGKTANDTVLPDNIRLTQATVKIQNAEHTAKKNSVQTYRQLDGYLELSKRNRPLRLVVSATLNDRPFNIDIFADLQKTKTAKAEFTLNGSSNDGNSTIKMEGKLSPNETDLWQGKIDGNIADIGEVAAFFTNGNNQAASAIPLSFNGNATLDRDGLILNRTEALIDNNKGNFAAYWGWKKSMSIAFEVGAEQLDLQKLTKTLEPSLLPQSISQGAGVAPLIDNSNSDRSISLLLSTDTAIFGQKKYPKLSISTELADGNFILHYGTMNMPGDTLLDIQGKVTQQPEGRRFSGTAKIDGKHLNVWLADFEPYAKNLPAEDFSVFALQGNLFISAEQLRLSEARMVINNFELLGGFATYFEKMPRVEAEIKLKNANIDYFRDTWRTDSNLVDAGSYQLLVSTKARFDWLKRLPAILDFNIAIDGFRFLDNDGQLATMRFYATPGEMSLYGIDVRFPDNTLSGNMKLNVTNELPKLDVVLTTNNFTTNYLSSNKSADEIPWFDPKNEASRFSDELFDVRWMSTLDGSIDLSVGKLEHNEHVYNNFKWRADLKNSVMTIQKLTFAYFDGSFDLNGTLIGGKVPSLSASFALYNSDLQDLLSEYFNTEDINGRVSITGVVNTSGIHMKSLVEQGDMKLTTVARGVKVKNLNLQSVVETTSAARSTQDVAEGVRNLVFDGTTELSVDGNVNFQQGTIKTPGIRLSSGRIVGNFTGELQLLPWTLNLTTQWQFPELSSTTIPTMSMSQQGDINDYRTRIDTASLEAFVAKRIIGQ